MQIKFVEKLTSEIMEELLPILIQCDGDFYPTLSSKRVGNTLEEKLLQYLKDKENFPHLIIYVNGCAVGFSNFEHNIQMEYKNSQIYVNLIDTTCIIPKCRGLGFAERLYEHYEKNLPPNYKLQYIVRETWSKNLKQIHLYEKFGYRKIKTIVNARGNDIHTYTYIKNLK